MNNNDPFGNYIDEDKTIFKPTPGGRKPTSSPSAAPTPPNNSSSYSSEIQGFQITNTGNNPLVSAAIALLSLIAQLRNATSHSDISALRNRVIEEIKQFELTVRQQAIPADQIQAARYALCTLLDETVLNTPWGCNSIWSSQSLLVTFHKETWGGEKFFLILKNCIQQPGTHFNLLELLYFCLCLGFEGRYRVEDHGLSKLEEIRENTYQIIQRQRGDSEKGLSLHWQGIKDKRNVLSRLIPLWVIGTVAALLLLFTFMGFLYAINSASNPYLAKLYLLKDGFDVAPVVAGEITNPVQPAAPTQLNELNTFLEPEVRSGQVILIPRNGKTMIRIMSKGLFASASDQIMPQYYPLLNKIGQALSTVSGNILVVGHTDNAPMSSLKFPSNWDLSKARAVSVVEMLTANHKITASIISEGRGDTQPMIANDSKEHKAMNRRVEIIL